MRGRPKGSKNKNTCTETHKEISLIKGETKKYKWLGFCQCGGIICDIDCIGAKYLCPQCQKRYKIKDLKKEKDKEILDKKEYLNVINTELLPEIEEIKEEEDE